MRIFGWCHNGYFTVPVGEVVRRARGARLDALIIKYGDPQFELGIAAAGVRWGVERFVYASQAEHEGARLADAVDAGAEFAVANCEPNDGGGWGDEGAAAAIRALIDTFRSRHPGRALYVCADLRGGRSLGAPFVREAARGGVTGWMPMVYPKAFGQTVTEAFDAAYPGAAYLGLPCMPVLQTYDDVGAPAVAEQLAEAKRRGAEAASLYVVEAATEAELEAVAWAKDGAPADAETLRAIALAYVRGALAILDHGTPAELAQWGAFWSHGRADAGAPTRADVDARLTYLRGALAILDHGTPAELRAWGEHFSRAGALRKRADQGREF